MQRFCKTVKRLNWKHLRCPSLSSRCHRACRLVIFLMQIGPFHLHTQFKESSFVKTHILLPLLHGTPSSVFVFFFYSSISRAPSLFWTITDRPTDFHTGWRLRLASVLLSRVHLWIFTAVHTSPTGLPSQVPPLPYLIHVTAVFSLPEAPPPRPPHDPHVCPHNCHSY